MTEQTTIDTTSTDLLLPDGEYAIVELLGHRTLVGRIAEVERFGTKLLQIEPIFDGKLLEPVYHHGSVLYALTPCSAAIAFKRAPSADYHLPPAIRARLEKALPPPSEENGPADNEAVDADYDDEDQPF